MNATTQRRSWRRMQAVVASGLALSLTTAGLAAAQDDLPSVSTAHTEPTRNLTIHDLSGAPLDELRLRDGVPRPFEVRITDTNMDPDERFNVSASMNNLHLKVDEEEWNKVHIHSSNIDLAFAQTPIAANQLEVALPITAELLPSSLPDNCGLDLPLLGPVCTTIGSLLSLLDGQPVSVLLPIEEIDLSHLPIPDLGFLSGGAGGAFTHPDCTAGTIGGQFADACPTPPTQRGVLRHNGGLGNLLTESIVNSELQKLVSDLPLVDQGSGGLFASPEQLLEALYSTADATADITDATQDLVRELSLLDDAQALDLLSDLFDLTQAPAVVLGTVTGVGGRYSSYPSLRVDTPASTPGGEYEGTLVVTMTDGWPES